MRANGGEGDATGSPSSSVGGRARAGDEAVTRGVGRRQFLGLTGAAAATGVAGCTQGPLGGGGGEDGDGAGGDGPLTGTITVTGSSTVFPLATAVKEAFGEEHGAVTINISPTGSGAGFTNNFCRGESDLNNASRAIKASEEELCAENGVGYHEIRVATDALTVVVNTEATWIDCLSFEDLRAIWGPDAADTWSEVRDEWPDAEIQRYGPTSASGTFDYFTEEAIGEAGSHTQSYSATEQDNQIITGVEGSEFAIGYLGFSYYSKNFDRVRGVPIEPHGSGEDCVEPTLETAKAGEYPLSRPLFTYPAISALAEDHIAEFCRFFVKRSASTELVAERVGYVPNSQAEMERQLGALELAIDRATEQ